MIRMMSNKDMDAVKEARAQAYARIKGLEFKRRAAIVKAVGEEKYKQVVIMANGVLWPRRMDGYDYDGDLARELREKKVELGPQWTPACNAESLCAEMWDQAGRRLEAKND